MSRPGGRPWTTASTGMSGEEAWQPGGRRPGPSGGRPLERARREKRRFPLLLSVGLALLVLSAALGAVLDGSFLPWLLGGAACCGALALAAVLALRRAGRACRTGGPGAGPV